MSHLQTYYHFKLDFQKVDQHTGGKWLIHGTKCRKNNQLQSLELFNTLSIEQMAYIFAANILKGILYGTIIVFSIKLSKVQMAVNQRWFR